MIAAAVAAVALATVRVPVANVWEAPGAGHLPLDPHVWPTQTVTYAQRLALVGHMPTQVLYGETVQVLARRGGWTKIEVPDQPSPLGRHGYPGWILSWQLGKALPGSSATVTVTAPRTKLPNGTELSFGTELPLQRRLGKVVQVDTPGGASWLPAAAVRPLPRTRADIVRSAEMFVGLHYLWGGLSSWGMDCSGLTWAAYRAHGITIPRDADAQYAAGTPVSMAQAKPGDLVFYEGAKPGHVAMLVGGGRMVEAPNSSTVVRIVPVRPGWVGVRRFL